jgi:Dolichyl-phosphate-mannose-protein mannosyltransferase
VLAAFGLYWGLAAFSEHRLGNYAVETDFYWKYGPAARDLLHGKIDIANYDSKGWGYPATVALFSLAGADPFRAAQILALLSALAVGWFVYRLHRSLLGPSLALLGLLLLFANQTFLANTYEVGTDMFFFAVVMGSLALLLRSKSPGPAALVASGILGGWAFSTRYNGLVLWLGALLLVLALDSVRRPVAARVARAGLWTAGFAAAALPWLWINAVHTGNPLTNTNYLNVGYEVYGKGDWEHFFYGGGRNIHSFADVVLLDPGRFVAAMARNIGGHLKQDLTELLPALWGGLVVVGAILLPRERPGRRVAAYLAFWALYFLTLVPVFYGTRFSMPLLASYVLLGAWPFVSPLVGRPIQGLERSFPLRTFLFLGLWLFAAFGALSWTHDSQNPEGIRSGPYELLPAVSYLKEHGAGEALLARKPHAAYLARMRFAPIPEVDSPAALHEVAEKEGARYLLVSGAELTMRATIRDFVTGAMIPGFTRVFESPGALVFEVVPMPGGAPTR